MINFIKKHLFILKIIPVVYLLSNCTSTKTNTEISQLSDIEIYKKGLESLKKGNLTKATLEFDDVFLNYPFSSLSSKSEIMSAYSLYQNNELKKAITKFSTHTTQSDVKIRTELCLYGHVGAALAPGIGICRGTRF